MPGPPASTPTRDLEQAPREEEMQRQPQQQAPWRPRAAEGFSTDHCHVMGQKDNLDKQHRITEEHIWAEIADLKEDPSQRLFHAMQFYFKNQFVAIID